jgi:hypothetical protein
MCVFVDRTYLTIEECTFASNGSEQLVGNWIEHHSQYRSLVDRQANGHSTEWLATPSALFENDHDDNVNVSSALPANAPLVACTYG